MSTTLFCTLYCSIHQMLLLVIYRIQDPDPADLAFFFWIRIRPDTNFKKRSGSGRILADIWPDPDPVILERLCFPPSVFFQFNI